MSEEPTDATDGFEAALAQPGQQRYVLRLYVSGMTARSLEAITRAKALCEERLQGRYELEVIDVYQRPELAQGEQIVACPTLVRKLPTPLRRLVGDLSDMERVLRGLDLRQA